MSRRRWFRAIVWLPALLATVGICFAQTGAKTKERQSPQIRVVSRLVNVSVVVRDKRGQPVTDLSRNDFTIYDGGRKQTIAFFRSPGAGPASSLPSATLPDVYSNVRQAAAASGGVTIILLDGLNTPFLDQTYARAQVIRFLKQIQPGNRVALYALGMKLEIVHDFTTDASTLIAALNQYQSGLHSTLQKSTDLQQLTVPGTPAGQASAMARAAATGTTGTTDSTGASTQASSHGPAGAAMIAAEVAKLNASIQQASEVTLAFARNNRQVMTLEALNEIARHVANVPGRKNLIWVAGDLPYCLCQQDKELDPDFYYKGVLGTEQLLSSVNVAVYPVDARGLFGTSLGLVTGSNGPATAMPGDLPGPHFAMEEAAKLTGGLAFFNTNDIMGAIHRAVSDAQSSYLLSYYPDHGDWNGEFRKLQVKVDQRGVKVRARTGYYATPALGSEPEGGRVSLAQIAVNLIEASGIRLGVHITPEPSNAGRKIRLSVKFDPHGVQFAQEKEGESAMLQYGFFQLDAEGSILGVQQQSSELIISQAAYEKGMQDGMAFSVAVPLQEQAVTLVVVLRDVRTGISGSVRIPLDKYQPAAAD